MLSAQSWGFRVSGAELIGLRLQTLGLLRLGSCWAL